MLVKVESLELAIDLYHAGLLRWSDGEVWSLARKYAAPNRYDLAYACVELEE